MLLLLAFVGFAGCLAAFSGGGGGEEPTPEDDYAAAQKAAVAVGQEAQTGNVVWKVTSAQRVTELKSRFDKAQGNFVVADLTLTNNGDEATTLDTGSMSLLDDKGRTHDPYTDSASFIPESKDMFLVQVNPGLTKEGRIIFEVAPDAQGLIMQVGDTEMFTDEYAYINLGV